MVSPNSFTPALLIEVRRRLMDEGVVRIRKCLAQISETDVWVRPNEHSNSIGNQILHLCGNVRQWILAGLGGQVDNRQRDSEFEATGGFTKAELLQQLEQLMLEVDTCLDTITAAQLLEKHQVQAFEETGLSILIHVVEHFSYHVGQITYIVKATQNVDLGYYADIDLNQKDSNVA